MQPQSVKNVAIIGAGPAGLLLAYCLIKQGIRSTIYEAHSLKENVGVGIVLSPNGLRLLDQLGIYSRLLPKGFQWEATCITTESGHVLERFYYGHQSIYGYKALRVLRSNLVAELTAAVTSAGVEIQYNSRFTGVSSDTAEGVSFVVGGRTEHADMLVGADGIHSTVRGLIDPAPLVYGNLLGIGGALPHDEVRWPTTDFPPAAIIRGKPGTMITFPENPEGTEVMIVTGVPFPEQSRAEWESLNADKAKLVSLLRERYDQWGDVNQSIIDAFERHPTTLYIWPFYSVPKLSRWTSASRRIVLVGDSAHAIPPSSGQGVSQAIEDVYSLAKVLGALPQRDSLEKAVDFWQEWRQTRVNEIERMVHIMNVKRMPDSERQKQTDVKDEDLESVQGGEGLYAWLFNVDIDQELQI